VQPSHDHNGEQYGGDRVGQEQRREAVGRYDAPGNRCRRESEILGPVQQAERAYALLFRHEVGDSGIGGRAVHIGGEADHDR
jgi:hypothetical protein